MSSLRSAGYSPGAAACDIVDNSITALATRIWLAHEIDPDRTASYFAVADNGSGMTEQMLSAAMVAGSRDSSKPLKPGELGRFGLGLKVASLSQGR
jgi:HSP90 family molecular chaperone